MLDDGFGYAQIVEDLSKHAAGLNAEHVRRWRSGGYQDYLREQRLIHQCVARTDHILGLLRQPGQIQPFQATQQIAAAQICQILAEIGPDTLRDALQSNPLNYFRMLNAFSRLTTGSLNCQRMLTEQAQINATPPPSEAPKKGLSPETLKQMNDKLHLL